MVVTSPPSGRDGSRLTGTSEIQWTTESVRSFGRPGPTRNDCQCGRRMCGRGDARPVAAGRRGVPAMACRAARSASPDPPADLPGSRLAGNPVARLLAPSGGGCVPRLAGDDVGVAGAQVQRERQRRREKLAKQPVAVEGAGQPLGSGGMAAGGVDRLADGLTDRPALHERDRPVHDQALFDWGVEVEHEGQRRVLGEDDPVQET